MLQRTGYYALLLLLVAVATIDMAPALPWLDANIRENTLVDDEDFGHRGGRIRRDDGDHAAIVALCHDVGDDFRYAQFGRYVKTQLCPLFEQVSRCDGRANIPMEFRDDLAEMRSPFLFGSVCDHSIYRSSSNGDAAFYGSFCMLLEAAQAIVDADTGSWSGSGDGAVICDEDGSGDGSGSADGSGSGDECGSGDEESGDGAEGSWSYSAFSDVSFNDENDYFDWKTATNVW